MFPNICVLTVKTDLQTMRAITYLLEKVNTVFTGDLGLGCQQLILRVRGDL